MSIFRPFLPMPWWRCRSSGSCLGGFALGLWLLVLICVAYSKIWRLGVAYSTLAAELVVLLYSFTLVRRVTHYRPSAPMLVKIIGATALMSGALFFLQGTHVLVMIGGGVVSYGVGLFLTRTVTRTQVQELF